MNTSVKKKWMTHGIAVLIFWVLTAVYFLPLFQGKTMDQSDIRQWKGAAKEILDYRAKTGHEALWTNTMFSGMPAYQISTDYPSNIFLYIQKALRSILPQPADIVFIYLLSIYVLLITLGINPILAAGGALGFAFASYNLSSIETGHDTKAMAIAYMPLVLAGVVLAFRKKWLAGAALTAFALALEIYSNHLQITYYLFLTIALFVAFQFAFAIKEKALQSFLKSAGVLVIAALLAIGSNISILWLTYEYGKDSTRGQSELQAKKTSSGLDKDYALSWSYGKSETMTLLIPDFFGGSSTASLPKTSNTYKAMIDKGLPAGQAENIAERLPIYWGDQPFTSGPVYLGAIFCFLFILGLLLLRGTLKWWLLSATILSIMLSWGKNFTPLTDLFFDYFPAYNKFRSVSMILAIAGLTVPLLGMLALQEVLSGLRNPIEVRKKLLYAFYFCGGLCLVFFVLPGAFFNFVSPADEQMLSSGYPDWLIGAIRSDRESILRMDALRSLVFIALSGTAIWLYLGKKIKQEYLILAISMLILVDLWSVGKRYLNDSDFVSASKQQAEFTPTQADETILADKDSNFRVMNLSVSTFNDATTSYYHKSIGGYHGAKLKRYQELIENQISKNNMAVLNMLNAKYFIMPQEKASPVARRNPDALGNAWFVSEVKSVVNADAEMAALDSFAPAKTAVVDQRFASQIEGLKIGIDSASSIRLVKYEPNELDYHSKTSTEQLAVFSEIYYDKGWNAYIDGKLVSHLRANYVLRALRIPAGEHEVVFKFEPKAYFTGEKIALGSSSMVLVLLLGAVFVAFKKPTDTVVKH